MSLNNQLKRKGYRITSQRQEVINVLATQPVTVQEIFTILQKKNVKIDLASIYRTLELFTTLKLVQVIEFGENKKRYEITDENNHHHHLINYRKTSHKM